MLNQAVSGNKNMTSIFKIAVSGGAASGKSSVCGFLGKEGIKVISLDNLAREVVLPGKAGFENIVKHFGKRVVLDDGTLDRAMLRRFMTEDPESKTIIESFVQPEIIRLMETLIGEYDARGDAFVVVEVPLLFELGMEGFFDASVLVCIDADKQVERLMARDDVTKEAARSLIKIQMPQADKLRRAEFIVENTSDLDALREKTEDVFVKIAEKKVNMSKSLDR